MSTLSAPALSTPFTEHGRCSSPSLNRSKAILAVLLSAWVTIPYHLLQHWPFLPLFRMEPGTIDRAVPFQEGMAWAYLSLFLFLPLAPLGLTSRGQVLRFATDVAVITLISHLIFALWPTYVLRPVQAASDPAYRLVLATDNSLNACPSLHASLAVYSALWCHRLLHGRRARWLRPALWAWTFLILYATLSVRQHVVIDLLAGAALAIAAYASSAWWTRQPAWKFGG